MTSESFRAFVRVVAPIRKDFASSRMWARSGMRLMSTRAFGSARRSFITGSRLWPPARTFASPPKRSRIWTASSTDEGAKYSNRGGITPQPPVLLNSAASSRGVDKGFSPRADASQRPSGRDTFRREPGPGFKISRSQEQVDMRQGLAHSRRRGFESRIVGIRVHPDDEMAEMPESSKGDRQTGRFAEVPTVAQDDDGRPRVEHPRVPSEKILQTGSDPSPSPHRAEVSRNGTGRVNITLPAEEARHVVELRSEREHPRPPDQAVERVHEGKEDRFMVPHRAAHIPQNNEFRPALPRLPESEIDPFASLSQAVSGGRGEIDRTSPSRRLSTTGPCGRVAPEPPDARPDRDDPPPVQGSQVMTRRGSVRAVQADTNHARAVDGHSETGRGFAGRDPSVWGRTRRGRYGQTGLRLGGFDVRRPEQIERLDQSGHVLGRLREGHDARREERVAVENGDVPQRLGAVERRTRANGEPSEPEESDEAREPRNERGFLLFPGPHGDPNRASRRPDCMVWRSCASLTTKPRVCSTMSRSNFVVPSVIRADAHSSVSEIPGRFTKSSSARTRGTIPARSSANCSPRPGTFTRRMATSFSRLG